jgi:hypothetical protein
MDKFSDFFKATVAVFHGIIATWLFVGFSEITVDQFQFLILLVFFAVANILIWNFAILAWHKIRGVVASVPLMTSDLAALRYRPVDVFGLTAVAIILGLVTAYAHRQDVILHAANSVVNWHRSYSDAPFNLLLSHVSGQSMQRLDGRDPTRVKAAGGLAYLRVYQKDLKFAYEGYPRAAANKRDPREIILSPACRYILDPSDQSKITAVQEIEGPGVFVRLVDIGTFEVIDRHQSRCAALHDEIEKRMEGGKPQK